jgi:hypothetical protein
MIYPPDSLYLRVVELENDLCIQDKLFCMVFCENKKLNLELESVFSEIVSLQSVHNDMSVKPCDNCTMIMVNYADLCLIHSHVASLLAGARLELRELKTHSTLLGACTTCHLLRSDLETSAVEIKHLKHKLDHSSRYIILSPPYQTCASLKGKLFHATKENTELQQEVTYLIAHLEKTILSEKMIEDDLSRVKESASKSTYKLGIGFERCEDKNEKSAPKFITSSNYHKDEEAFKPTKTHYPSNPKSSFNPKREVKRKSPKSREEAFVCMFCGCAGHLDEFCFWLVLSLILCRALLHALFLSSLMDLTIAHMVLFHERTTLSLDALVTAHVLIVVVIFHVGLVFLQEGFTPVLSRDTWTVHIFPVVVLVPLVQTVMCKRS